MMAQNDFDLSINDWGVKEGLPHREVNDIVQDSLGFIWLGTPQGLTRFDGRQFKIYTIETDSFLTNNICRIFPDQDGRFWLFPDNLVDDIDIWCPRTRTRTTFRKRYGKEIGPALFNAHQIVISAEDGSIFIQDEKEGKIWVFHHQKPATFIPFPDVQKLKIFAISQTIWGLGDDSRIIEFDFGGRILQRRDFSSRVELPEGKMTPGLPQWFRNHKGQSEKSYYQITTKGEIEDHGIGSTFLIPLIGQDIPTIGEDLFIQDPLHHPQLIRSFTRDDNKVISKVSWPRASLLDRNGVLWLGDNFGLRAIEISRNRFGQLLQGPKEEEGSFMAARGMLVQGQNLYACFEFQGLVQYELNTGEWHYLLEVDNWGYFGLHALPDRRLLVGAHTRIYVQQENRKSFQRINVPFQTWSFYQKDAKNVWMGTDQGLWNFRISDNQISAIHGSNHYPELAQSRILQIVADKNGSIWLCTNRGLFLVDQEGRVLNRYSVSGSGQHVLPVEDIRYILPNPDGSYWLATGGGGLIHFFPGKDQPVLQQLTMADGLSSNTIHAILPDRQGQFWLSSDYGIMKFNPKTYKIKTFLKGLAHVEGNRIATAKGSNGEMFIGSINGVTSFHPDDFQGQFELPDPRLVVTRYEQFDGDRSELVNRTAELDASGIIDLEPTDRFFRLEFALLTFPSAGLNHYAYILEGLEDTWQYGSEHTLRFGRPPYGQYTLRIRGQDESGNWSSHELNIQVNVRKPFWLQTWFLVLSSILFVGVGFMFYLWRTRNLRYQKVLLQQLVEERTGTIQKQNIRLEEQAEKLQHLDEVKSKLFANVSHELRTPLTLIMGPISSVLKSGDLNGRHDTLLRNAQRGGKKLLGLINEILDLSKMESGLMAIQESPVHIHSLIRRFVSQFESMARMQSVHLAFESVLDDQLVVLADADKLEKVVNNYLANAFKHTPPEGYVTLRVEEEDALLRIVVADTGEGIHPEELTYVFDRYYQSKQPDAAIQGGTGIGLALVKEYALLLGGDAWVESIKGHGATFYFTFPKKESFDPVQAVEDLSVPDEEAVQAQWVIPTHEDLPLILIVEDNPGLRDYLQLILQEHFRLLTAAHGQEALDILVDQTPHLILSDIIMPIMDGYQLISKLKASDTWRGIPLIMLTARADIRDKLEALRIGVDDYLIKPFNEGELQARIRNLLARAAQRQAKEVPVQPNGSSAGPVHSRPPISGEDMAWLAHLEEQVMVHLCEDDLTADRLSREVALSRRQLFRRIKELTGMTPNEYINEVRFREARRHLEERTFNTVKSVAHAIGFRDVPYFSRQFLERFGKRPSEYLQD